ncbi:hypothetical protein JCM16303_004797, partial [Sporobolomyces ruberrimus]
MFHELQQAGCSAQKQYMCQGRKEEEKETSADFRNVCYIAGVFCAVVSHPADTMVSKLNAPLKPGEAKPAVGSIYSEIGFGGLWAGLGTRIFMIGTLT